MLFKFPSIGLIFQRAKKFSFTACQSGNCSCHNTILNVISTGAKKKKLISVYYSSSEIFEFSKKNFTEFISPIAKSTCPSLSDTFFIASFLISCTRHLTCIIFVFFFFFLFSLLMHGVGGSTLPLQL